MQNLPRIFINEALETGKEYPLTPDQARYLQKVMRTNKFLAFHDGTEFQAEIVHSSLFIVHCATAHSDPSNNLTLAFAPIKQARMEEMLNMATQMGVAQLRPVITDRTVEKFPKWERIRKIIIEASEQSGRNSIPELLPPAKFAEFLQDTVHKAYGIVFGDERFAHDNRPTPPLCPMPYNLCLMIGPEGGFSPAEFAALDAAGAVGISLGKTILRAETAAVVAIATIINAKCYANYKL